MEALKDYVSDDESEEDEVIEKRSIRKRPHIALSEEPSGEADGELAARLAQWRAKGSNPTQQIRQNREFANPQILQKIVEYFGINEYASAYPKDLFDPDAIIARRASSSKASSSSQEHISSDR